jgi:hypothetical protein
MTFSKLLFLDIMSKQHSRVLVPIIKPKTAPRKLNKGLGALVPLPQIIRPDIPKARARRLLDSATNSRAKSESSAGSSESEDIALSDVARLPLESLATLKAMESKAHEDPKSSRSSAIIATLTNASRSDLGICLDNILAQTEGWANGSITSMEFGLYHLLTQFLFATIKEVMADYEDGEEIVLLKALAICVKVMPASDREPLTIVVKLLYGLSKNESLEIGRAHV